MTTNLLSTFIRRMAVGSIALTIATAGNQAWAVITSIGTSQTYSGATINGDLRVGGVSNPLFTINSSAGLTAAKGAVHVNAGDDSGPGRIIITGGGILENSGHGRVGNVGLGTVTVTGENSQWNNAGVLYVGHAENDTLIVENGASVTSGSGSIGSSFMGTVTVMGTNSQWNTTGSISIGAGGNGGVNVELGGTVTSSGGTTVGYTFGKTGSATVSGTDSQWNFGDLTVGLFGDGIVNVEPGGTATSSGTALGHASGSTGTVMVTGVGAQWNNTVGVVVGYNGSGMLNVEAGGKITTTWSEFGGIVGYNAGSTGTVTVTGADSVWNTGRELSVGYSGNGTLNVEAGGNVTNPIYGYVGNNPGSTGTVIVKGANSQLSNFNLYVGNSGSGTLNVEDRGNVTNQNGYVGTNLGSSGTVIVTGAHSRWINNANLYVGDTGNGTLNVQGGGIVSNQNGYIGANSGSTGTVMVTDTNSNWNNTGSLYIGGSGSAAGGTGSLSISNSGKVTIAGTTKIWNEGTLTINGGILDTQHFDASIGTFNFVSGVLQVSGTTTVPDALVLRNGSTLFNNGTIAAPVVVGSGGFVKGTGNFGSLTVNSGGIVSPGLSPGKLTDMSTAWNSGGTYLWEINRLATNGGVAGLGLGWDLWNTGALTIGGEFTINLASVTAGSTAGALPGWSTTAPLSWQIATANNGAFTSIAKLTVNSQIFQQFNSLNGGGFSLASANSGNSLLLYFTPAVVVEGGNLSAPNTSLQGNSLSAGSGNTLAIDPNAQVSGFGAISPPGNTQTITNSGTISANVPRQTLSISSQTFVNQGGTVQATGGGILNIDAETYTQTSGTTNLGTNGTVTSSTFEIQGGTLSGSGTINTTLVNNGTVAPGNSPGMLTIDGSYTQEASGILEIELAGLLAGEYDQLIVTGDANLAGTLSVNLIDGFELGPNQWFDILVVGETQAGTFAGLADHALVGKFGGYDLFITYATSTSGAGASLYTIPEPGSLALAATGLLGLLALGRRHRFVTGREW